jgi:hypothetical protein
MNTAEKKLDLITWLAELNDSEILEELDRIKKRSTIERYQKSLQPMSSEELRESLAESEEDYRNGRIISQEELERRIKEGRIL